MGFVEVLKVCGFPRADSFNRGHDRKARFTMIKTRAFYRSHRVSCEDVTHGVFYSQHPTLTVSEQNTNT
jgi:hypothetical protein